MRHIAILWILCIHVSILLSQQEVMTTQYINNKMALNPAIAGDVTSTTLYGNYRKQWIQFPGAPTSQSLSINIPLITRNIGLGFSVDRHTIGVYDRVNISGDYSFGFKVGKGRLAMGLETSIRRYSADFYNVDVKTLEPKDKDPSIPGNVAYLSNLNAGVGAYYKTSTFYLGASIKNLVSSAIDFDNNDKDGVETRHFYIMGGYTYAVSSSILLEPQFLLRATEGIRPTFDLSLMGKIQNKYAGGLAYRSGGIRGDLGESIDIILGMHIMDNLYLSASYDVGLSQGASYHQGSMEVGLVYTFASKAEKIIPVNPRHF